MRRERARESAAGITAYATDAGHRIAVAALAGQLVVADLRAGTAAIAAVPGPVVDPRPDPTGTRVAWVRGRALWVAELADPASARAVAEEDDPEVRWGVAEFVAAEEMDRYRGYWWSPDGLGVAGRSCRRRTRAALVDRRSGTARPGSDRGGLSGGRHAECRRLGVAPPHRRDPH